MLKIIEKPSPLMIRAIQKLESGAKTGEKLSEKHLNKGDVNIVFAETYDGLYALDKIVNTTYKRFKTRFIYDGKKIKRWIMTENTPHGEIRHKVLNSHKISSGELRLPDRSLYLYTGFITNPLSITKYGQGQKVSKEEFDYAINFIRRINAKKAYS